MVGIVFLIAVRAVVLAAKSVILGILPSVSLILLS